MPDKNQAPVPQGEIHIRTDLHRKNAYVRAAKPGKLTDWMLKVCDQAAGYTPPPDEQPKPGK